MNTAPGFASRTVERPTVTEIGIAMSPSGKWMVTAPVYVWPAVRAWGLTPICRMVGAVPEAVGDPVGRTIQPWSTGRVAVKTTGDGVAIAIACEYSAADLNW